MCVTNSSVWARYPDGTTEKLVDDVLIVRQQGEEVALGRLFGGPLRMRGTIYEVDFSTSTVTLNLAEAPTLDLPAEHEHEHAHDHPHPHPHSDH